MMVWISAQPSALLLWFILVSASYDWSDAKAAVAAGVIELGTIVFGFCYRG